MNIYTLRHGIAVERGATGFHDDARRPLMVKGEERIHAVAQAMRALELSFDHILSSPYLRASQTAEIVAKVLEAGATLEFCDHLVPEGDPGALIRRLKQLQPPREDVLLVGHEPYLSRLIGLFIAGNTAAAVTLKKGGLARLELDKTLRLGQCASLAWLLTPKQLCQMVE
jgi:phosphohistidine phosphatase